MLPAFTLSSMANGHIALNIQQSVDYESFPRVAEQLVSDLGGSLIRKVDSPDVLLWKIQLQGQELNLVYDEMSGDFSLESDSDMADTILESLLDNNKKTQTVMNDLKETPVLLNRKFLALSLARLLIFLALLLMAISSFFYNFMPSVDFGATSLVLAAVLTWLVFRFLIHPILKRFREFFSLQPFSWKEFFAYIKRPQMVLHAVFYLAKFKGFYIAFVYIISFLAICFSAPVILDKFIAQSFTENSTLFSKSSSRSLYCRYHLKVDGYGNGFSSGICVKRSVYSYIRAGDSVKINGSRSWAGVYIKDVFNSGSSGY